jgi:hypothetical protein
MHKFKGRGQQDIILITYDGILELIMILPGINASVIRSEFASILKRYFAGDPTLVSEVIENNQSNAPINALARETGREVGLEIEEFEEQRKRRRLDFLKQQAEVAEQHLRVMQMFQQNVASLSPMGVLEDRDRLHFRDLTKNMYSIITGTSGGQQMITNGSVDNSPLTISSYAAELGIRMDNATLQRVGKTMALLYRQKYDDEPSKHQQYVDGACRSVNTYYGQHRPLLRTAFEKCGLMK